MGIWMNVRIDTFEVHSILVEITGIWRRLVFNECW